MFENIMKFWPTIILFFFIDDLSFITFAHLVKKLAKVFQQIAIVILN